MFRGLYTAYTGMRYQQVKVDSISNNIANADTAGFKKDNVIAESFKDVLTYKIRDVENKSIKQNIGKMSLGIKVAQVYTDFKQGPLKQTDQPLDVAISGTGFFKVGEITPDGNMNIKYTRDGSFGMDQENNLVTKDGLFVLSEDKKINLEDGFVRINKDGSIYQGEALKGKIDLVDFDDLQMLRKEGDTLYITTDKSVEKPFESVVEQGFLEMSSANGIDEMIDLIQSTRIYESNQKVIQTYDETMGKVVNEVGRVS